jgi:Putative peptidoglycan binding domain
VVPGATGGHVRKIQQALIQLDGAGVAVDGVYGPATAAAIAAFKQKRAILNSQGRIDNIVGKKTVAALDTELLAKEEPVPNAQTCILVSAAPIDVGRSGAGSGTLGITGAPAQAGRPSDADIMAAAFRRSRSTLRSARDKLFDLANALRDDKPLSPTLTGTFNIAAKWLNLSTSDRKAAVPHLDAATLLMLRHINLKTSTGADVPMQRVAQSFHAATFGSADIGLQCGTSFFDHDGPNCRRDVVTHELFHLLGVGHGGQPLNGPTIRSLITTTAQALNSADNLAQLVAQLETPGGKTDACVRAKE